jgi:hypothetical protein
VSEETVTHGQVNARYIKPLIPNTNRSGTWRPGPGTTENAVWMFGKDLEGMDLNFCWGIHKSPGVWLRGPGSGAHVHPHDEVMLFAGTDPSDIDYLGAEIQIDMGPERERHIIDKPTAVVCPAGVQHAPIVTRWVDRPFGFLLMSLAATHDTTYVD